MEAEDNMNSQMASVTVTFRNRIFLSPGFLPLYRNAFVPQPGGKPELALMHCTYCSKLIFYLCPITKTCFCFSIMPQNYFLYFIIINPMTNKRKKSFNPSKSLYISELKNNSGTDELLSWNTSTSGAQRSGS